MTAADVENHIGPLVEFIVKTASPDTRVTDVSLFIRNYTTSVSKNDETGYWDSTFGKNADTIVVVTFITPCRISADANRTRIEVNAPGISGLGTVFHRRGQSDLFGIAIEDGDEDSNEFTLLMTYDGKKESILWDLARGATVDMPIFGAGFELAQSISGSFSLAYIHNYLQLSRYRVYSPPSSQNANKGGTYSERDFGVQLMVFLEYVEKSRRRNDEYVISAEKRLHFKTEISSIMYDLDAEKERIRSSGVEKGASHLINRIF